MEEVPSQDYVWRNICGDDFRDRSIIRYFWQKFNTLIIQFLTFLFLDRYAMKCLDKKRIKMKQGETLALNERIMLSLVSTGVSLATLVRNWEKWKECPSSESTS